MSTKIPDPKFHFILSMIKSGIRIVAAVFLMHQEFSVAGLFFLIAEVIGIAEELV